MFDNLNRNLNALGEFFIYILVEILVFKIYFI